MGTVGPQLVRKTQIGGRVESTEGTSEALAAFDFKTRMIVGAGAEYEPNREPRDIARPTLTNLGSIEGKKQTNINFTAEVNTPDVFDVAATADLDVNTIDFVSGNLIKYAFNGSPTLTGVSEGDYFTSNYATNASNNGTFLIESIGASDITVVNRNRTDNVDDEATDSPAIGDIQSPLEYAWAFEVAGTHIEGLSRIAVGVIASGPYQHGETITGGTSSATGRIVVPAKDGDSFLYFEVLTGKFITAELITGGTSGANATSSSGPNVHGYSIKPISDCFEVATVEYQEDGYAWSLRSGMCNVTGEFACNRPGFFSFEFQGPRLKNGDKTLTTGIVRGQEDPPILKTADLAFDAASINFKPVFTVLNFDMGNNVVMRQNGNASDDTGFESARITSREPKVTITLEHELAATFDFFTKLDDGTKTALEFHDGTSENKQFWFFADELEFQALPPGDADGVRTLDLEAMLTGNAADEDDEWQMAFIGD